MIIRLPLFNRLKHVALAVSVVWVAAGCGGSDSPAPAPGPAPAPPPSVLNEVPAGISLFLGDTGGMGNIDGVGAEARFGSDLQFASGAHGQLLVLDRTGGRIRQIDAAGKVSTAYRWDPVTTTIDALAVDPSGKPFGITVDSDPAVSLLGSATLMTWDAYGTIRTVRGIGRGPKGRTRFDMAADGTVVAFLTQGVARIAPDGASVMLADPDPQGSGVVCCEKVLLDGAGTTYVKELSGRGIFAIRPNGTRQDWARAAGTQLRGLWLDSTGQAWTALVRLKEFGVSMPGLVIPESITLAKLQPDGNIQPVWPFALDGSWSEFPSDVAVGADGSAYLAFDGRVYRRAATGEWQLAAGSRAKGGFAQTRGQAVVSVGADGTVFVDNKRYNRQGRLLGDGRSTDLYASCDRGQGGLYQQSAYPLVGVPFHIVMPAGTSLCPQATTRAIDRTIFFLNLDSDPTTGKARPSLYQVAGRGGTAIRLYDFAPLQTTFTQSGGFSATVVATPDDRAVFVTLGSQLDSLPYTQQVLKFDVPGKHLSAFGASGSTQAVDGAANAARFIEPLLKGTDAQGNVYLTDRSWKDFAPALVRYISPDGSVNTLAGQPNLYGYHAGPLPGTLPWIQDAAVDSVGIVYVVGSASVVRVNTVR